MYILEAIIFNSNLKSIIESKIVGNVEVIELSPPLSMIPMKNMTCKLVNRNSENMECINGFQKLSKELYRLIADCSENGRIGYVEAEYFGGLGGQSSIAFENGNEILKSINEKDSINHILRFLGIQRTSEKDEFDLVNLDKYRDTEKWKNTDA